jgi:hypothetical protein
VRSCLIQLILLLAFLFALLWFGLPLGVDWLATTALNASGFSGTNTTVTVTENPPPLLLTGHADSVRVTSSKVTANGLQAGNIDLTLGKVDLFGRKFETVSGSLDNVTVPTPDGLTTTVSHVTVNGTSTGAAASLILTTAQATGIAESELRAKLNAQPSVKIVVTLQGPDRMTIVIAGRAQGARLVVVSGSLVLVPDGNSLPSVTLIAPSAGNPFHITALSISSLGVKLDGTIDLQSILF